MIPGLAELLLAAQLTVAAPDCAVAANDVRPTDQTARVIAFEPLPANSAAMTPYDCCGNPGCTCNGSCKKG